MRRLVVLAAALAAAAPALAVGIERHGFRYTRPLVDGGAGGPVVFEPDGPLFAHSRLGFPDLRILDARGEQVPWRRLPVRAGARSERVRVLNSGRRGGHAVALLDLGRRRRVRDRVMLDVPDSGFAGRAVVLGADRRAGPFTRLSATGIYDIRGARRASSTVAVFPPSDFRYLMVRATAVSRIVGAAVSGAAQRPRRVRRAPRSVTRREHGTRTVVTLDFRFRNLPVDELRIEAHTPRYERPVAISGSNGGGRFRLLTAGRVFRFAGSRSAPIAVGARHRLFRIEFENGDDAPLRGIQISARSRSHALLVAGGRPRPYALYYGKRQAGAPSYDFGRLPPRALGLARAGAGRLGGERPNASYEPPGDTRSFAARHPRVVEGALALAALALAAVGLFALRKRS